MNFPTQEPYILSTGGLQGIPRPKSCVFSAGSLQTIPQPQGHVFSTVVYSEFHNLRAMFTQLVAFSECYNPMAVLPQLVIYSEFCNPRTMPLIQSPDQATVSFAGKQQRSPTESHQLNTGTRSSHIFAIRPSQEPLSRYYTFCKTCHLPVGSKSGP